MTFGWTTLWLLILNLANIQKLPLDMSKTARCLEVGWPFRTSDWISLRERDDFWDFGWCGMRYTSCMPVGFVSMIPVETPNKSRCRIGISFMCYTGVQCVLYKLYNKHSPVCPSIAGYSRGRRPPAYGTRAYGNESASKDLQAPAPISSSCALLPLYTRLQLLLRPLPYHR